MKATLKIMGKIDLNKILVLQMKKQKELLEIAMKTYEESGITKKRSNQATPIE